MTQRSVDLSVQVALVTGASRGLGREISRRLAGSGARVGLFARSAAGLDETRKMIEAGGGTSWTATIDVTDHTAVDAAVQRLTEELGTVELLGNNAGVGAEAAPIASADPEAWWSVVETNLRGNFLLQRAVLPGMLKRHQGRIINIVSNAGIYRWPWMSAYSVSKAAAIKLAENLAAEVRKEGIAVFAFHPGLVNAGLTDKVFEEADVELTPDSMEEKIRNWFLREIDAGKLVPVEQVAEFVLALASGGYDALSGRYLTIDYDLDALLLRIDEVRRDDLLTLRLRT